MSIRNEEIGDLVLDAARRCLLRGGRRVTLAEIAREANVSRPTVYRRWPDVSEVIRSLLTREVLGTVSSALAADGASSEDLPTLAVRVVVALRSNELLAELWAGQREVMAPYVFERMGTSQQGVHAMLSDLIAHEQGRGTVRRGDPKQLAAMVLVVAQTFLQSGALVSDILADDWREELRLMLEGYLRPAGGGPA